MDPAGSRRSGRAGGSGRRLRRLRARVGRGGGGVGTVGPEPAVGSRLRGAADRPAVAVPHRPPPQPTMASCGCGRRGGSRVPRRGERPRARPDRHGPPRREPLRLAGRCGDAGSGGRPRRGPPDADSCAGAGRADRAIPAWQRGRAPPAAVVRVRHRAAGVALGGQRDDRAPPAWRRRRGGAGDRRDRERPHRDRRRDPAPRAL